MHTSTRLSNADFKFWQQTANAQRVPLTFDDFCTDYHELDRIGVVSPALRDGILGAGRSLLALTTAFYDSHRTRAEAFFDYPQHFAFVGSDSAPAPATDMAAWRTWSMLDVWPENKWSTRLPTATEMLRAVFDFQINRLFWPQNFWPTPAEEPLPDYAYKMLQTRLKMVYFYSAASIPSDESQPSGRSTIEILGSSAVQSVYQESLEHLPALPQTAADAAELLQPVAVAEFIERVQPSFA